MLVKYATDSEPILQEVIAHYGVDRSAAEGLFDQLTYGGSPDSWRKKHAPAKRDHPQIVLDYAQTVRSVINKLVCSNPNAYQVIRDDRDEDTGELEKYPETALLSNSLRVTERKMTDAMRRLDNGRNVQSILIDGAIFGKLKGETDESIRDLENECTAAVRTVVPTATCEAIVPQLPDWLDPEIKIPFEGSLKFADSTRKLATPMSSYFLKEENLLMEKLLIINRKNGRD